MGEHNTLTNLEKRSIESLSVFSHEEAELLRSYGIISVDGLLGATQGLQRIAIFDAMQEKDKKLRQLIQMIPKDLLVRYQRFEEKHPTGWLGGVNRHESENKTG